MPEHAESIFKEGEDLNIHLGKKKIGGSSSLHNSLWISRWTKQTENKQGSISHSESTKTRVAERLVIGVNRHTTTNSSLLSTGTNEDFRFYFNSVTQKDANLNSCEVLEGSDHFPVYGIKRKIESILNLKGKALVKERVSELNVAFHSSKEFRIETQVENPKNHRPTDLGSCSCTEEANFSSSSQIKCPSSNTRTQSMNLTDSLSGSSRRKAEFLFEMLTVPTESYYMAQSGKKSKNCEENFGWDGMTDNLRKFEGQFERSDALQLHNTKALEPVGGLASSLPQKVMTCHNSTRSNYTATAPTGKSPLKDKHIESLSTTNLDPGLSRTVTTDATRSFPEPSAKPKLDSNLTEAQQKPSNQEAYENRWLKRLRHDISSNALVLEPEQLNLKNNNRPTPVSEKKVESWIRRWYIKKLPSEGAEKFGVLPGEVELQGRLYPSVAAMAMMGKAMNKIRPGEFQQKGPLVVWNNSEF